MFNDAAIDNRNNRWAFWTTQGKYTKAIHNDRMMRI